MAAAVTDQPQPMLGFTSELRCHDFLDKFQKETEQHFQWLNEILAEAKSTFTSPEIQLLPKTPSCKRTRRGRAAARARVEDDEDVPAKKRTRKGKKTRVQELRGSVDTLDSDTSTLSATSAEADISADDTESTTSSSKSRSTRSAKAAGSGSGRSTRAATKKISGEAVEPKRSLRFNSVADKTSSSDDDVVVLSAKKRKSVQTQDETVKPASPIIPGFGKMTVKAKAQAYEEFLNTTLNESLNHSVTESPGARSKGTPTSPRKRTPRACQLAKTPTQAQSSPNSGSARSRATVNLSTSKTPVSSAGSTRSCKVVSNHEAVAAKRRSSVRGSLTGIRKSLSKRRSSMLRDKLTESQKTKTSNTPSATRSSSRMADVVGSDTVPNSTPEKPKRTRSKMKTTKPPPTLPVEGSDTEDGPKSTESEEEAGQFKTPEPVRKTTRSKMRKPKAPPKLESTDSEADGDTPVAGTPQRKGRTPSKSRDKTPKTGEEVPPASDEHVFKAPSAAPSTAAPIRSTRSKMRKCQDDQISNSPSLSKKRRKSSPPSQDEAPRKKSCPGSGASSGTQRSGPRILKPGDRSAAEVSCPSEKIIRTGARTLPTPNLPKKTTPCNLNTTATSFIQRHTPQKGITVQENLEQLKQKLVVKDRQAEVRLFKRQELIAKKAKDAKRKREEREKQVQKRLKEQAKHEQEARKGIEQREKEAKTQAAKAHEEKIKEEKERQKLREKKIAEAEHRRKQEEETRLQRLKEAEEEKKQQEELFRRKQEFEEAERKKRVEEERKQEEERKAVAEKERLKEAERLRKEEEKRKREEEERARQEEERRRREKAERDRINLEKQIELEKKKQEEVRRQQEMERQRLREEAERAEREEAAKKAEEAARKAAAKAKEEKLKQQNANLNSSYTIPSGQAKLNNSTANVTNPDSYIMTPPSRPYKKGSKFDPDNYNIDDLNSGDETDDEDQPRKAIPAWAQGANLKVALINQYYHPPNLDDLFETIDMPDLNTMFNKTKPRFNKRTSSAIWTSPILKHSEVCHTKV